MSAHGTRIWVVITDGVNTRICSSGDGMTTPITTPSFLRHGSALAGSDLRPYRAWFKAERQGRLSQNPRHQHILHVGQLLLEAAQEGAYDGLIVIAPPAVAAELGDALPPQTRALLIGEIVHDHTIPARPDVYVLPELRH